TALHKASINGDAAVVRLLLENGADVHATEAKMGATPLHWAALYARREIVQVLVAAGAD
ncbi:ankyrin, partial [Morchella conica CCBAS932]